MVAKGFLGFAGRGGWGSGNPKPEDFGGEIFKYLGSGRSFCFVCALAHPPTARTSFALAKLPV